MTEMPVENHDRELLSLREYARIIGVSVPTAYNQAHRNQVPGLVRVRGSRMAVRSRVLYRWLRGEIDLPTTG